MPDCKRSSYVNVTTFSVQNQSTWILVKLKWYKQISPRRPFSVTKNNCCLHKMYFLMMYNIFTYPRDNVTMKITMLHCRAFRFLSLTITLFCCNVSGNNRQNKTYIIRFGSYFSLLYQIFYIIIIINFVISTWSQERPKKLKNWWQNPRPKPLNKSCVGPLMLGKIPVENK